MIDSYLTTRLKFRITYEFIFQNKKCITLKMFKGSVTLYQFFKLAKIKWNYLTLISGRLVILRDLFGMPAGSSRNYVILR